MWPTGVTNLTIDGLVPIAVEFAEKRWLHGRLRQLATRVLCYTIGHKWTGWYVLDDEVVPLHPEIEVVWSRGCRRFTAGCGALQLARASSLQIEDGALDHGNDLHHRFSHRHPGAPEA